MTDQAKRFPLEFSSDLKSSLNQISQDVAADLEDGFPGSGRDPATVASACMDRLSGDVAVELT